MTKFGSAFSAARKAGKKTFEWNGKSYTTELKDSTAPTTSTGPKARPRVTSTGPKARPKVVAKAAAGEAMTPPRADSPSYTKAAPKSDRAAAKVARKAAASENKADRYASRAARKAAAAKEEENRMSRLNTRMRNTRGKY